MIIVSFYAALREQVGTSVVQVDPEQVSTTGELFDLLAEKYPALGDFRGNVLIAINEHYARWADPVQSGDQVAFFPPVSGGGDD